MEKLLYEKETVGRMIKLYCRKKHKSINLCPECNLLKNYAEKKLLKCPFGNEKTYCSACSVHCYVPEMREKIRRVMRFSGPRMLIYYPIDFLKYCFGK